MARTLLKYFKLKAKHSVEKNLLDENGPLCREVPASSIREANLEVWKTQGKMFLYLKMGGEQKALIAKYAAENGIVAALGHFAKDYLDGLLKESTVRGWKKYLNELGRRKRSGEIATMHQNRVTSYTGINSRQASTSIFDSYS